MQVGYNFERDLITSQKDLIWSLKSGCDFDVPLARPQGTPGQDLFISLIIYFAL